VTRPRYTGSPAVLVPTRKRGRPRRYPNRPRTGAERQAKWRRGVSLRSPITKGEKSAPIPPNACNCKTCSDGDACVKVRYAWNVFLAHSKMPAPKATNFFMTDAPQGCGRLVTGGYDSTQIESVDRARHRVKVGNVPIRAVAYSIKAGSAVGAADRKDRDEEIRHRMLPQAGSTWKEMGMTAEQIHDALKPLYDDGYLPWEYRKFYEKWFKGLK